jgi:hypothetical protein
MLAPKKVKFRKQQRGRMKGIAKGSDISFGEFGLQALEPTHHYKFKIFDYEFSADEPKDFTVMEEYND